MKRSVVVLCLVGMFALIGASAAFAEVPVPPFEVNQDCLDCHDVAAGGPVINTVDFAVPGAVDYERCKTCHLDLPDRRVFPGGFEYLMHYHGEFRDCIECHESLDEPFFTFPDGAPRSWHLQSTPYGYFAASDSLDASPEVLHDVHMTPGWVESYFGDQYGCSRCHATASCNACHGDAIPHGDHALPDYPGLMLKQADGMTATLSRSTCLDPACHSILTAGTPAFNEPTCLGCHKAAVYGDSHGYDSVNHVADLGDAAFEGAECASCHYMDLMTEHEKETSSSVGGSCLTCHPSPRDTYGAWETGCQQGGCHAPASPQEPHTGILAAHTPPAGAATCGDCHGDTLDSAHLEASTMVDGVEYASCSLCHRPDYLAVTADCTSCHFTLDGHYDEAAHVSTWTLDGCMGDGCHTSNALMTEHEAAVSGFACVDCHAAPMSQQAIADKDTACNACHTSIVENDAHRAVHWANPPLVSGSFPDIQANYSYYLGTAGTAHTTDCAGCHTSNIVDEHMGLQEGGTWLRLPRGDRTGTAFDCATCHNSLDASVMSAIALDQTACDACHTVHGPIPAVHASTFVDNPPVDCSSCHSANLAEVHNSSMTTVTESGRTLSGCDMCHSYYDSDGPRGVEVQDAIAARDTRCTACHTDYHGDMAAHKATMPASVDDCGRCHGPAVGGALNVESIHYGAAEGSCAVCHSNPSRVSDISSVTAECASCHAVAGETYHRVADAKHTFGTMDAGCLGSGCHAANTLPEEHERFLGRYPAYTDTCALCHLNEDGTRIDWTTATADCSTCHEVHGDIDELHTTLHSQECMDCHMSADVRVVHGDTPAQSCAVCHNATVDTSKTAECVNCHKYSPVAEKHYKAQPHVAQELGFCSSCHDMELAPEHLAATPPVDCVGCHAYADFPAEWDLSCASCHPVIHADLAEKHTSQTASCAGAGCHAIGDVAVIHDRLVDGGCWACHSAATAETAWSELSWTGEVPAGTTLSIDVFGTKNGTWGAVPGYTGLTAKSVDLSGIDPAVYPRLSLEARFESPDGAKTPRLDSWTVTSKQLLDGGELEQTSFFQTSVADFTGNALYRTVATDKYGIGSVVLEATTDVTDPGVTDLLFAQSGRERSDFNQYLSADNAWNMQNSAGFTPSSQSSFDPRRGATMVEVDGRIYLSRGDGKKDREVYTPPSAGGVTGSWSRASDASSDLDRGSDAAYDASHDQVYYTRGGEKKEILKWQPSRDRWSSAINFRVSGSDRSLSSGSAIAYAQSADRLFVIDRNRSSGTGRLYYLSAPSSKSGNQNFAYSGIQVSLSSGSERWNRMVPAKVGGTEYLFVLGRNSRDRDDFQVVSNLASGSQRLTAIGKYPFSNRLGEGCDLKWDGGEYLYAIPGGDRWEFARIKIPADPTNASAWGSWEMLQLPTGVNRTEWREGSCIEFLGVEAEGVETVTYYDSGTMKSSAFEAGSVQLTTDCLSCHVDSDAGHRDLHDSTLDNPAGCQGCHFTNLVDEHSVLGHDCQACHASMDPKVTAAITSGDQGCLTCHPDSPHNKRQAYEFNPANASGHNVPGNVWPKTSFLVNGQTYTMHLPDARSFINGWTRDSMMTCSNCHSYDDSQATGPHGATVKMNIDPAYPRPYRETKLDSQSASAPGFHPDSICAKCHSLTQGNDNWHNRTHEKHARGYSNTSRQGTGCATCHVGVPHGWIRPRLIGYRTDPEPYRTPDLYGFTQLQLRNYSSPNDWQEADCAGAGSGCEKHRSTRSMNSWN